jgi:hypothetical protein
MTVTSVNRGRDFFFSSVRDDLFMVPSDYQEMPSPQMPKMFSKKQ